MVTEFFPPFISEDLMRMDYSIGDGKAELQLCTIDGRWYNIVCREVIVFNISNTPGDEIAPFVVDVTARCCTGEEARAALRDPHIAYGCRLEEWPETLYHIHCEGGTVVDILTCKRPELECSSPRP